MKRDHNDKTGRVGVHAVGMTIEKELDWVFREQPTSDYGIDAHVELVDSRRRVTGRLVAFQIKAGESYFREEVKDGYVYRGDIDHLNYWMRHSLPVIVALHNLESGVSYWQVVTVQNAERTEKGWKMVIPSTQVLNESARTALEQIADIPPEQRRLASLAVAKAWMELLRDGKQLFLKAEEWINKSSGRGSLTLFTRDDNGNEEIVENWPFVMFPGELYAEVLPALFPWADLQVDSELYDQYDEEAYDQECGVWDSEDDRYIMHTQEYEEWSNGMADVRPYTIESGEVALFQLELTLNDIGKAYLSLEKYLSGGLSVPPQTGRIGNEYGLGLKRLARMHKIDIKRGEE